MKSLIECATPHAATAHLELAFQRLQILDKYIASTEELMLGQEPQIKKLTADNEAATQEFMRAISDSLEIMQLYRHEILACITELGGPRSWQSDSQAVQASSSGD